MDTFGDEWNAYLEGIKNNHIKGYLTGDFMKGYLCDMCFAQLYAQYNHLTVQNVIRDLLLKYGIKVTEVITSVHNFIDLQDHILRKSSIRSYVGEKMLVPFNMRDGVAVCEGKSNSEWLNSCSHGAGRKMSRSEAKRTVTLEEFKTTMEGIYSTTVCTGTIDESPTAYKDTNEIANLIVDTCVIKYMMKPRINIKATDEVD
jgi:RNA-splicing ligase RtcB